jgi:ribosomal protein L17
MGQLLHGSARTTAAVRRAIQQRQESLATLAKRDDLNPKTVAKWKHRSYGNAALIVAFRRHTRLPLDDCL